MKDIKLSQGLKEVALLFLRLGATSFGGPAAYIALMHHEVVVRRKWIDDQKFLDIIGAVNLIPGPNATEVAAHLGLIRAGWLGLIVAGGLFILPGTAAIMVVAWAYVKYGSLPQVAWVLYGVKPAVIAIIVQAVWSLAKTGIKSPLLIIVGLGVLGLYLLGLNEILLLLGGAVLVVLVQSGRRLFKQRTAALFLTPALLLKLPLIGFATSTVAFSQTTLFLTFLKMGATLFGSGYVLLAFLNSEFVLNLGWLTHAQVVDAIAVAGQITPGPVFNSAAFIGYLLGGWPSALLAVLGIFLPSFILVGLLSRFLPTMRKSWLAGSFLDGINAASLGLMAAVAIQLGRVVIIDPFTIFITLGSLFLILRFKINSAWLVLGGGALGVIYKLILD
ncbi:MAG: chromate efflux transporter [Dehalococcoidales bacterium]|nr:chromate efflux transporter [Dehalococcoidales bacterium]